MDRIDYQAMSSESLANFFGSRIATILEFKDMNFPKIAVEREYKKAWEACAALHANNFVTAKWYMFYGVTITYRNLLVESHVSTLVLSKFFEEVDDFILTSRFNETMSDDETSPGELFYDMVSDKEDEDLVPLLRQAMKDGNQIEILIVFRTILYSSLIDIKFRYEKELAKLVFKKPG